MFGTPQPHSLLVQSPSLRLKDSTARFREQSVRESVLALRILVAFLSWVLLKLVSGSRLEDCDGLLHLSAPQVKRFL